MTSGELTAAELLTCVRQVQLLHAMFCMRNTTRKLSAVTSLHTTSLTHNLFSAAHGQACHESILVFATLHNHVGSLCIGDLVGNEVCGLLHSGDLLSTWGKRVCTLRTQLTHDPTCAESM